MRNSVNDNILNGTKNKIAELNYKYIRDSVIFDCQFCLCDDIRTFKDRLNGTYQSITENEKWGENWQIAWFCLKATVPDKWQDKKIAAWLDIEGEGLIYDRNGELLQGITSRSVFIPEFKRDIVHLIDKAQAGKKIQLWLEGAANGMFGLDMNKDPELSDPHRFGKFEARTRKLRLCLFDPDIWHFLIDAQVLYEIAQHFSAKEKWFTQIITDLNKSLKIVHADLNDVKGARHILAKHLTQNSIESGVRAIAIGHAHIDTAWLWPVRETIRKCARTFSTQIRLLEKYPDYIFGASQAQLYQFVKDHYPALYQKVKEYVKAGRFEVQGGMWVEADCNITGGESLIRQILLGKNFFRDEFNIDVKNLWLPDVFGYSAALPQILKKSGIDYFLTQKISWNDTTIFPHHTFIWQGIDGSGVITHFPPENTYNSMLSPQSILSASDRFAERSQIPSFLSVFGVGDGGGGPKEENIESGLRMHNLHDVPQVRFASAADYFEKLSEHKNELEIWQDELYLEKHRGTLTTQALLKKMNRKLEFLLRHTEILWSCLPVEIYPQKELEKIWKLLLINQFHDILPGTCINEVIQQTHKEYKWCEEQCRYLLQNAADKVFNKSATNMVLFNTLSFDFTGIIELPKDWKRARLKSGGEKLETQDSNGVTLACVNIPALGLITIQKVDTHETNINKTAENLILENNLIRYEFDTDGCLISVFDKEINNEILPASGKGNLLSVYNDRPKEWDAWDIDIEYEQQLIATAKCQNIRKITDGPLRQKIQINYSFAQSTIAQYVILDRDSKRLDFETKVDWHEKHRMLRVSFPVDIQSEQAAFDIQYGFIKRNTHRKTDRDKAKFEVAGHKYADLSDDHYGVALMNDCKYGYKVYKNVLDLNLLRSPNYPDPDADQGRHTFAYSLLPHKRDLIHSDVIKEAHYLNQPPLMFEGYAGEDIQLPVKVVSDSVSLEVIKKAEKQDFFIIRLVELKGENSRCYIDLTDDNMILIETDLMEWNDVRDTARRCAGYYDFKPFEIRTFKLLQEKQ